MSHDLAAPQARPPRVKIPLAVALVVAVGATAWGLAARAREHHQLATWAAAQEIPTVQLVAPLGATAAHAMTLPGHIDAWASTAIHARVGGYLKSWSKDIGSDVKAGAALAVIETPELDQQLDAARAALARANASERLSQLTSQRWQHLLLTNSVSKQEADEKSGEEEVARANVQSAQAEVARLQALESFKTISAPFAGTVTSRNTDIGDLISATDASSPPLFTVSDTSRMRLYVSIPQGYAGAIRPGMKVSLDVLEHPGQSYQATLIGSSDAVNQQSGSLLAQFEIPNADHALMPGAYAQVSLPVPTDAHTITLPATVMLFRAQGAQVAVADASDHVRLRDVHIAVDHGDSLEIDRGLSPGDRIIDHPSDSLAQGDAVHVIAPSKVTSYART
jgi:membrane fusion protein (multidrug efflux system)